MMTTRNTFCAAVKIAAAAVLMAACFARTAPAGTGADSSSVNAPARDTVGAARLAARRDTASKGLRGAVSRTPRAVAAPAKAPPIDIRALSIDQPRQAKEPVPAQVAPQAPEVSRTAAFLAALVVAASSTILLLLFVVRRPAGVTAVPRAAAAPAAAVQSTGEGEREDAPDVRVPDEEDDFYGVGKDMRSAREEFALAMRLHTGSMGDGSRRQARSACSAGATVAERVRVARRLGIGRGEIDLALRLQKLETIPAEEEHS